VQRPERTRPADAAWLGIDRPENLLVVTAVLRLAGALDLEVLRARVQEKVVDRHPRLQQLARPTGIPLVRARWHHDPAFDLRHHVVDAGPEPLDDAALQRLAAGLLSQPLDPDRPAWRIDLVRRSGGGSALVARFHHGLADGMALATVLLGLTDDVPATTGERPGEPGRAAPVRRVQRRAVDGGRAAGAAVALVARLLVSGEPRTRLRGPLGTAKSLALTGGHDLAEVREVARARGATVNDVLLAATAGGLRAHLAQRGGPVADLRVIVPVDLRGGAEVPSGLGNLFGVVVVRLPVGEPDAGRRLQAVRAETARLTASAEAGGTYLLLRLVGVLPRVVGLLAVALLGRGGSAVVTNVPGPRHALALGGCRVEDVAFWAPTVGRIGLGISLFSYAGAVTIGVALDAGLGLDADGLAQAIEDEIAVLATAQG
jgi:WS/DGAT/MGAT family acyltransferase